MSDATPITSLIESGLDSFSNLYDVRILLPSSLSSSYPLEGFSIRATSFTPPELTVGSYDASYKLISIKRPNSIIDGERKFNITFRMDAEFLLYKALLAWKNIFTDPTNGGHMNFGSLAGEGTIRELSLDKYGSVSVVGYKPNSTSDTISSVNSGNEGASWAFNYVMCSKVGSPQFSREGTDAITVNSEFIFGTYDLNFPS